MKDAIIYIKISLMLPLLYSVENSISRDFFYQVTRTEYTLKEEVSEDFFSGLLLLYELLQAPIHGIA